MSAILVLPVLSIASIADSVYDKPIAVSYGGILPGDSGLHGISLSDANLCVDELILFELDNAGNPWIKVDYTNLVTVEKNYRVKIRLKTNDGSKFKNDGVNTGYAATAMIGNTKTNAVTADYDSEHDEDITVSHNSKYLLLWSQAFTIHDWKHIKKPAGNCKDGKEYDECQSCHIKKNEKELPGYSNYYVKSFKVKKAKKSFVAKWTKQSKSNQKKFSGYQIQYSLKSNMSGAKYATAKKSASSKKISKLKAKKKYYVRIRTYKTVSGKKYYSKWSARKSVTTV